MKSFTKIVITGGPCAGKTTALSRIQKEFSEMGYKVVIIPETSTEIIKGGFTFSPDSLYDFQKTIFKLQQEKERLYCNLALKMYQNKKILIVCDRGILDEKAYMPDEDFYKMIAEEGCNEVTLRDTYDAVFHLVTAANGAAEYYTTANNSARTEDVTQAIEIDNKLISAWTGHPHMRLIDNSECFENKIRKLISEISLLLGEPESFETERKFLIEYPDIQMLSSLPNCTKIDIIQTYLNSPEGLETRVRQRGQDGCFVYFKTTKKTVSAIKRFETEEIISEAEYLKCLMDADTTRRPLHKSRYCLMHCNKYFEIDVYPFWNDKAILEIELADENEPFVLPDFIKVIKEVTDDINYKNAALAKY